ncbi:MAG: hypothetical protein GX447_09385 [Elusimicrobia bacterium]|nr:hypothetical protein [Elusimicrobiota bacterium]
MKLRFFLALSALSVFAELTAPKEVLDEYEFFKDYELFENMETVEKISDIKIDYDEDFETKITTTVNSFNQLKSSFTAVCASSEIVKSSQTFGGIYEKKK